jgi:hypothetical protein
MEVQFDINVKMEERWIPYFMSMLKHMEHLGNVGSTRHVIFVSDGDGDFRPKFNTSIDYDIKEPIEDFDGIRIYDAG